jgi:predicted RNase H-like HicB family nuclease
MKLKIILEKGMDGYIIAHCPALKGCVTQGHTEEEALNNLKEAIELYLESEPEDTRLHGGQYKVCELAL